MTEEFKKGMKYERIKWLKKFGSFPGFAEITIMPWLQKRLNKLAENGESEVEQLFVCQCGHLSNLHSNRDGCLVVLQSTPFRDKGLCPCKRAKRRT